MILMFHLQCSMTDTDNKNKEGVDLRDIKYRKQGYSIIKTTDRKIRGRKFVVFKNGDFKKFHTHVTTLNIGKTMIFLVANNKMPKSNNKDFIESLIRLSENEGYIKKLKQRLKNN